MAWSLGRALRRPACVVAGVVFSIIWLGAAATGRAQAIDPDVRGALAHLVTVDRAAKTCTDEHGGIDRTLASKVISGDPVDLNGDGRNEMILNFHGSSLACCGGNRRCMWVMLGRTPQGWRVLSESMPTDPPEFLATRTNGYKDFRIVDVTRGEVTQMDHAFNGQIYKMSRCRWAALGPSGPSGPWRACGR